MEVKEAVTTWFEGQSKDFFSRGIKLLQQKWAKCIELLGDYIEKYKKIFVVSYFFLTQVDKLLNAPHTSGWVGTRATLDRRENLWLDPPTVQPVVSCYIIYLYDMVSNYE